MTVWMSTWLERVLLAVGVVCLGTYALETLEARRYRNAQEAAFARASAPSAPTTARREAKAVEVPIGGVIGMLEVPRLQLSTPVVEGDGDEILDRAVGHLPDTPLPGQDGNSALAAHRDGLFRPLKDIEEGDEILLRLPGEDLRYRVLRTTIVDPDDLSVLDAGPREMLTLITCYPFYYVGHAPRRFIVHAVRD